MDDKKTSVFMDAVNEIARAARIFKEAVGEADENKWVNDEDTSFVRVPASVSCLRTAYVVWTQTAFLQQQLNLQAMIAVPQQMGAGYFGSPLMAPQYPPGHAEDMTAARERYGRRTKRRPNPIADVLGAVASVARELTPQDRQEMIRALQAIDAENPPPAQPPAEKSA